MLNPEMTAKVLTIPAVLIEGNGQKTFFQLFVDNENGFVVLVEEILMG